MAPPCRRDGTRSGGCTFLLAVTQQSRVPRTHACLRLGPCVCVCCILVATSRFEFQLQGVYLFNKCYQGLEIFLRVVWCWLRFSGGSAPQSQVTRRLTPTCAQDKNKQKAQQIIYLNIFKLQLFAACFCFVLFFQCSSFGMSVWTEWRVFRSGREECASALTGELARAHVHAQRGASAEV